MINQQRRTVLKGISLLAALPVISISTIGSTSEIEAKQQIKVMTLTNLTPKTLRLDNTKPISLPEASSLKLNTADACGAVLKPGGQVSFKVIAVTDKESVLAVDTIEIKSDQPELNEMMSVMGSDVQITMI